MAPSDTTRHTYKPDYAVPPGETVLETIETLGMDQRELALRTGLTPKTINQIVKGKAPITHETAIKLERVTGVPTRVWNNLEMNYREQLAKMEDQRRPAAGLEWLKTIPTRELVARGAIEDQPDKAGLLRAVLAFFGVSSTEAWKELWLRPAASFRKSRCFQSQPGATATWLRLGQLAAQEIQCQPFDKARFAGALRQIRRVTTKSPEEFVPRMSTLCAGAGVAVVFVPEIKGCTASGAARWLTPAKALIQLSLRYKTEDHLWFSFFHEAGHVLNDAKKEVFIDDGQKEDEREKQANRFAADLLIPPSHAARLLELRTRQAVVDFAKSISIAPGIVVGRLQREGVVRFSYLNDLKRRFTWSAE